MRGVFVYLGIMLYSAGFLWGAVIPGDIVARLERGDAALFQQIVAVAEIPHNPYRLSAPHAIAKSSRPEALAILHKWAEDKDITFRIQAILALGARADERSVSFLKYLAMSEDAGIARAARRSLVQFKDPDVQRWITTQIEHRS